MKLIAQQRSETPLYLQLYNQIVTQILNGSIAANECLPSIRFVARDLEISVIPVKTAYELLEKEGYIYTIPAKGCFAADLKQKLADRKTELAKSKIEEAVKYCIELNLTKEDVMEIVGKLKF